MKEQTAMPHYVVLLITPTTDAWIPDYLTAVAPLLEKHGAKFLARTQSHERLEGTDPSPAMITIIEWPSKDHANAFYNDPAYQPHKAARLAGATNHCFLVEGKDDFAPA